MHIHFTVSLSASFIFNSLSQTQAALRSNKKHCTVWCNNSKICNECVYIRNKAKLTECEPVTTQSIFKLHVILIVSIKKKNTKLHKLTFRFLNDQSVQKCWNIHTFQQDNLHYNYNALKAHSLKKEIKLYDTY